MVATVEKLASPAEVAKLLRWSGLVGLDLETTGLDPRRDRIRLLSVSDGNQTLVMDCFEHDIRTVLPSLAGKVLVAHNAAFDLGFLYRAGLTDLPETICTFTLALLVTAGQYFPPEAWFKVCALDTCCSRWLNRFVSKTLRTSDWSGPLSAEQVEYARLDSQVLLPLFKVLAGELATAKLDRAAEAECNGLRGFVWLSANGAGFDRDSWKALAESAEREATELERKLEKAAPVREKGLFGEADPWKWTSTDQMAELFERLGFRVNTTADAQLAEIDHPVAELLRRHRSATKKATTYGLDWLEHVAGDGRVYPQWHQLGTAPGRTSCSDPNLQQIPRDGPYRSCFLAGPGKVLVKADYAHLQMRIACRQARDEALLKVFRSGEDPHTATARMLLSKAVVSKADRQIAKSANFGLLFGMSAPGLQVYAKATYGVDFTKDEANRHRSRFFQAYPGLSRWHERVKREGAKETRSRLGRRRILPERCSDTWRLNSPVQADEADGLKIAMGLLWDRRAECPDARPVLAIHDEIVVECPADCADQAREWLTGAMFDAMQPILDPVPCVVEASVKQTWGE